MLTLSTTGASASPIAMQGEFDPRQRTAVCSQWCRERYLRLSSGVQVLLRLQRIEDGHDVIGPSGLCPLFAHQMLVKRSQSVIQAHSRLEAEISFR